MDNHFGNSVIKQCCKKVGGVKCTKIWQLLTFLKAHCFKSGYLERFTNFRKTKLNMVYNTLKKIF